MADFEIYGLGDKLKSLRKKYGYTQKQVAERLGISANSVAQFENEGINPSTENIIKYAIMFNTSIDYLYGLGKDSYLYLYDFTEEEQRDILDFIEVISRFKK